MEEELDLDAAALPDDEDFGLNATATTVSSIFSNQTLRDRYPRCPAYDKPSNVSTFVYLLSGPINLGTGIMGILINVATLIVLAKQHQFKATPKIIMMTLAVSDIIEIVNQWVFWGALKFFIPRSSPYSNFLFNNYHYFHPVYRAFLTFNRGITLLMTIDRWFIVCRTLLANRWWTKKKVFWVIGSLAFYSIAINIPNIFEYIQKVKPCTKYVDGNATLSSFTMVFAYGSPLGCNKYFIWIYMTMFHSGVVTFLPCLLMIIFNALTIRTLTKKKGASSRRRQDAASVDNVINEQRNNSHRDAASASASDAKAPKSLLRTHSQTPDVSRSITIMCVSVTMLFVVLQTPYIVHNIGNTIYYRLPSCIDFECKDKKGCEDIDRQTNFEERVACFSSCKNKKKSVYESAMFLAIVSTCLMLNSSINGCIYFCAGTSFRQKFFEIFMPWKCRKGGSNANDLTNSVGSTRIRTYSNNSQSLKIMASNSFSDSRNSEKMERKV